MKKLVFFAELIKLFPLLQSGSYASAPAANSTTVVIDDVPLKEMGDGVKPKVLLAEETQELLWCEVTLERLRLQILFLNRDFRRLFPEFVLSRTSPRSRWILSFRIYSRQRIF